ncbi:MAG: hemerythrin domain-containing protein [Prevotella sp.]|nr:hemerythrin domain-containing protein [Prevotella sp.]
MNRPSTSHIPFETWDLDLLVDYILKFHHRNTRKHGARIHQLLLEVASHHPELDAVADHFRNSLQDLDTHCMKEENVLYPYILDLYNAADLGQKLAPFHCGSIQSPINMMMMDHDDEMARHERIRELTHDYTAPADASDDYKQLMMELRRFRDYLLEHIWMENEIVFPWALKLEGSNVEY